jgi:hypothetical protein
MDGDRFDSVTKAAMFGGRRTMLRNLGLFAGGLAALIGAREVDAEDRKRTARTKKRGQSGATAKPKRRGGLGAEAKPENPGRPPHDCCAPCPATGNECTFPVRNASTGDCEQVARRSGLPCGTNGFCSSNGACIECDDTLCPSPGDPSGDTVVCENLERGGNVGFCGSCTKQCNVNEESCCGDTCYPHGECNCVCADAERQRNCSCQ